MEDLANITHIVPRRVRPQGKVGPGSGPAPDTPVYVIGVLHGQIEAFSTLLEQIDLEPRAKGSQSPQIAILGDVIGGAGSAALLASVKCAEEASNGRLVVLMGKRDRMLLEFLLNPAFRGPEWLAEGGKALLRELGIPLSADVTAGALREVANAVAGQLGDAELAWLSRRPLFWRNGNLVCAYAALDPFRPLSHQSEKHVLGGHPYFHITPRRDENWVVYAAPGAAGGVKRGRRIAVGGGLILQDRVDAVRVMPDGQISFLTSRDEQVRQAG